MRSTANTVQTTRSVVRSRKVDGWGRLLLVGALALVVYAATLPLWGMILHAPQYPDGLQMSVGPGFITGDLGIINVLNHYVGMREIHLEEFWEIQALPYILGVWALAILAAAVTGRTRWVWIALVLAVVIGAVGMLDLQYWLWDYGNNLDPRAPLDLDPFTPPMMGEYTVWNFSIESRFISGTYVLGLAGLLLALAAGRCLRWDLFPKLRTEAGRKRVGESQLGSEMPELSPRG